MEITIVTSYFPPEIGAASSRIKNMSEALSSKFDIVNIITPLPNYPKGKIFKNYKGKFQIKERTGNVNVFRFWIHPSNSKNIFKRILSMFSFAISLWSYSFKISTIRKSKWIIIQNSPLLISFSSILLFKYVYNRKIALNVSDLWPLSALELKVIKKGRFYFFLEWIEYFNYRNSDLILGQSKEILQHVAEKVQKPSLLYRNLPIPSINKIKNLRNFNDFKIVYAGLLGIAQGVFDIIENIDFQKLDIQFDIYGNGNELLKILKFIENNPNSNIHYKGSLPKHELLEILPTYHASIVPLKTYIKGAVPSKIFELVSLNIPILLLGEGEASKLIKDWSVGYVSKPQNFVALEKNIQRISKSSTIYDKLCQNCEIISNSELDFDAQIENLIKIIK
ncbi:glycosyltransferase family 4 protein [Flavobacteriales bacterium]|nr:glycosyltransferase family 4 protein [Flavobacteriales bacterium]